MASATGSWKSRDELKQEKQLEEARKAGTALPLTDEHGKDISPHIPQYIAQAPWYLSKGTPTLSHQRLRDENEVSQDWYLRGAKKAHQAKIYRKGACSNCGAMGHDAKMCLARPRKLGAKFTNQNIEADDIEVKQFQLSYDGARDRWNGYDPNEYQRVFERYQKVEETRRKLLNEQTIESVKEQERKNSEKSNNKNKSDAAEDLPNNAPEAIKKLLTIEMDEDKTNQDGDVLLKGDEDQVGTKVDSKTRTTIRNLRIREDTAKYLLNLDLNSAYYDPKTRSMRANPLPHKDPTQIEFAGENFIRATGHSTQFENLLHYSIEANDKGQEIHLQAAPSQSELLHKEYVQKKKSLMQQQQQQILAKYGGEDHLNPSIPKVLLIGQTENYIEYAPDGRIISGASPIIRSKWPEDQLLSNHTSVWGSFWQNGKWGFACCHQFEKNSYCTGEAGKLANKKSLEKAESVSVQTSYQESKSTSLSTGKAKMVLDENLLREALKEEEIRIKSDINLKRKYDSLTSCDVTEEQLEAYRIKRMRSEDPMAHYFAQATN